MVRRMYDGYSLKSLREWASDLKVAGRSKMGGLELLAACRVANLANIRTMEQAVLPAVKIGALLRNKSTGDVIRVTGQVYTWEPYGALCVPAEYVECDGWGDDRREERAAYENEWSNARRTDGGPRHPLWQYEAV